MRSVLLLYVSLLAALACRADDIARDYSIVCGGTTNYDGGHTNFWAAKRCHIDLSLDGGQSFPIRLAYGYHPQTGVIPDNERAWQYVYSLPAWRTDWITETAQVRVTALDGTVLADSALFTIAGIAVLSPAAGTALSIGNLVNVSWRQAGAGEAVQLGLITPDDETWAPLTTFSNCVAGVNSALWVVSSPSGPLPRAQIVFRSVSDQKVMGNSGEISIQ